MLRTGQSLHPASTPASRPTPGVSLPGPWRLPGPDSHRLAVVNLSLGYVMRSTQRGQRSRDNNAQKQRLPTLATHPSLYRPTFRRST